MQLCGSNKPHVNSDTLKREHDRCRQEAIDLFRSIRKMGGDEKSRVFQEQLEQQIDMSYANNDRLNAGKSIFANFQFQSKKQLAVTLGLFALMQVLRAKGYSPF